MTSIAARSRDRKNRPMEFIVPFPSENPEYEFTVKRMPEPVVTNAINLAIGKLRDSRTDLEDPKSGFDFYAWKGYHLVEQGVKHFVGWKHLHGEEQKPFSQAAFTEWLSVLTGDEKKLLGIAYMRAEAEADAEKKDESENTDGAS
jgi:hypothetical protein